MADTAFTLESYGASTDEAAAENLAILARAITRLDKISAAANDLAEMKEQLTDLTERQVPWRVKAPNMVDGPGEWFEEEWVPFDLPQNDNDILVSISEGLRRALIAVTFLADRAHRARLDAETNHQRAVEMIPADQLGPSDDEIRARAAATREGAGRG